MKLFEVLETKVHSKKYCMHLSSPKFFKQEIIVNSCSPFDRTVYSDNIRRAIDQFFSPVTVLMEATKVTINYQQYQTNMFLFHGHGSGIPEFCKIIRLLFYDSTAFFYVNTILQPSRSISDVLT